MTKEEEEGLRRNRDDAIEMVLDDAMRLGGALGAFLKCGPYNQPAVTCAFNAAQVFIVECNTAFVGEGRYGGCGGTEVQSAGISREA